MSTVDSAARRLRLVSRGLRVAAGGAGVTLGYELLRATRGTDRELEGRTKRALGWAVLRGAGFRVDVQGAVPRERRPRLILVNHRSAFDIALMLALAPDPVMLSRADVESWPVLGRLANHGHTLYVDRADRSNGARAIRTMRRALSEGETLCVFPEGTTHAESEVRPFQAGAVAAARGLDVEVVPIGIAYARGLEFVQPSMGTHVSHVLASRELAVSVVIGAARPLPHGTATRVASELRDVVQALVAMAETRVR